VQLKDKAKDAQVSRKRRVSQTLKTLLLRQYKLVKLEHRKDCIYRQGPRLGDRLQKRMALGEITVDQGQESKKRGVAFGFAGLSSVHAGGATTSLLAWACALLRT
jgi:hypothetical protein